MHPIARNSFTLVLSLGLSACGLFSDDDKQNQTASAAPKAVQTPLSPKEVETLKVDINTAMSEIPPELRNDFQSFFACEVKRDKSPVTGQRIRSMTAALKADRSLARCQG